MFGSHVLETVAGLAFIYLILSVFASAISEWISAALSLRAKDLEAALRNLLAEDASPAAEGAKPDVKTGQGIATALLNHSLIQNLCAPKLLRKGVSGPAYLEPRIFSSALLDLLVPAQGELSLGGLREAVNGMRNQDLKRALAPLVERSANTMDAARANIENWFNQAMDRVGGRYKRRTQMILFLVGLVLAVGLNVDTPRVAKKLWADEVVRAQLVEQAKAAAPPASSRGDLPAAGKELADSARNVAEVYSDADMPVGWVPGAVSSWAGRDFPARLLILLKVTLGWVLTAIAICFGAPFWFDFLNKTLGLNARLNGAQPAKPGEAAGPKGS